MGFLDALRQALTGPPADRDQLTAHWKLEVPGAEQAEPSEGVIEYDWSQWRKKLKHILENLPRSQGQWDQLMADARSKNLDPEWVAHCQREEFALLVRRAVADGRLTEPEHLKLDLARFLIGMPEAEAEQIVHQVVAEAEDFFWEAGRRELMEDFADRQRIAHSFPTAHR